MNVDTSPRPSRLLRHSLLVLIAFAMFVTACGSTAADDSSTTADETAEDQTSDVAQADETSNEESSAEDHGDDDDADDAGHDDDDSELDDTDTGTTTDTVIAASGLDASLFLDGAIVEEVTTEPCTLSGGAETECYSITVSGDPVSYDVGPFCPTSITDTAEAGGIWFDGNDVYELDGEFFTGLAELYGDDNWLVYDDEGNINVVESADEFDLAARPDVDPSVQNHCVEGRVEWLENGEPVTSTVLIPVEPVLADGVNTSNGNLGVTLDGIVIAQSAPVDAILSAYTIAAFDDCGGHYNPVDGYHLHGAVGCSEVGDATAEETPMFAYAMDGFPVHSALADPDAADLDECGGHDIGDGYHYHANPAEENLVIECFMGQTVSSGDAGRPAGPRPGADE